MTYQLMAHQQETADMFSTAPAVFIQSDPGTGKSLAVLHAWAERRRTGGGRMLVFAPKTCVQSVWLNEVTKFFSDEFRAGAALAPNREPAFHIINDVVATNHDAVKWLLKQPPAQQKKLLSGFDTLIWDESDTLRHNSARTKAALKLTAKKQWEYKACLTGTPFNKSVAELFFQTKFLDGGIRLGKSFYKFRSVICEPIQVGPGVNHIQWHDKEDSPAAVAGLYRISPYAMN